MPRAHLNACDTGELTVAADFADRLADAIARDGTPWEKYVLVRAWL